MKVSYSAIKESKHIVIWGTGRMMHKCFDKIDPLLHVDGFCDSFSKNWADDFYKGLPSFSKDVLSTEQVVMIAIEKQAEIDYVSAEMDEKNIRYCHIKEAVEAYRNEWEVSAINKSQERFKDNQIDYDQLKHYINIHVPYKFCNLACEYCYVRQEREFQKENMGLHSPEYIRAALSPKRWGGISLINFCAEGETLLAKELLPIIKLLIEDGHYIQIVTNGTASQQFDDFIKYQVDLSHILFKFSYHYLELKKKNLLDVFAQNVQKMKNGGASITLELVPSDELIPYIEELKSDTIHMFGALPQLTVPRDITNKELKILTKYEEEEYRKIWEQFNSKMFEIKMENYQIYRSEYCMAGVYSVWMDLAEGDIYKCCKFAKLQNIYDDICEEVVFEPVGHNCEVSYCYNGHIYLPFGVVRGIEAPSYYQIRDRECEDGTHWISEKMKNILSQKLDK